MTDITLNLLLAYEDGELSPEESQRVEAALTRDPALREQLEAQRQLRQRVDGVLRQASMTPADLATRVRSAMAADDGLVSKVHEPVKHQSQVPQPVSASNSNPLSALLAWVNGPRRVSFAAVAAVFVIVGAAVLVGIFGQTVDDVSRQTGTMTGLLSEAAAHVSQEHDRCVDDHQRRVEKVVAKTPEEAVVSMRERLGVADVTVFDLSHLGYQFIGEGPCNLPGAEGRSSHLLYSRSVPGQPERTLSLFIAPDSGVYDSTCGAGSLEEGRWRQVCGGPSCRKRILHAHDEALVYFLACCDTDQVRLVAQSISEKLSRRGR